MDGYRRNLAFLTLLVLFAASGAGCPRMMTRQPTMPRVLPPQPTVDQVIAVVNQNSSQIQSFSTDRASITIDGYPTLRASVAVQRPARLRLQADTALTSGPEFDLGSNDVLFWFWFRGDPQNAVYSCRHDCFGRSAARGQIPIAPAELMDALGLAQLDPALPYRGPFVRADGLFELRAIRETEEGPMTRISVIDPRGWIAAQFFYDARGQMVLRSMASDHRQDPLSGLVLPRIVDIACPQRNFHAKINLGNVAINTLSASRADLWEMPLYDGARPVDLGDPNVQLQPGPTAWRAAGQPQR